MKFDVYGNFQVEVLRLADRWVAYELGVGTRVPLGIAIPPALDASEIAQYLDDIFHEAGGPGDVVRSLD